MNTLYLVRGLPGSGKSTFAEKLAIFGIHLEADMYFMKNGKYEFDASKLHRAHEWCRNNVESIMLESGENIIVSNTSTTEKEMKPYLDLAGKYDYRVVSLIVENRHFGKSTHGVPDETMDKMEKRFSVKLR